MIIFGYRGMAKLLGIVTLVCRNCGNPAAQRIVRHSRWFTLFFIPVFPISMSRSMTCTFCAGTSKLTKEQAEQLVAAAAGPAQPVGPPAEQLQPGPAPQPQPHPAPQSHPETPQQSQPPVPPAGPQTPNQG